jgi:hypothetical protein
MFNLIMLSDDWSTGRATMPIDRVFEYTDDHVRDQFRQDGSPNLDRMTALPSLFMQEGGNDEVAAVGHINRARLSRNGIEFEYAFDRQVPSMPNEMIYANRLALDITHDFEFSRNHWAIKGIDLYRFLFRNFRQLRQRPNVFQIAEHENIEPSLASAMMPFDASFNAVYACIQEASQNVGLRCRRADNIWENPAIIQDVVSLIDRSRIVICDCTGRNPNVFYEAGIAHTLGREVILVTQSEHDIPFDLRHLRYIRYLNNAEGLAALASALRSRMQTILGH